MALSDHHPSCILALTWKRFGIEENVKADKCQFCKQANQTVAYERYRIKSRVTVATNRLTWNLGEDTLMFISDVFDIIDGNLK